MESFGRRNVLSLRQNLAGRIMDLEKDAIYQKYKERVGEVVSAEVYQIWKREILLVDDEDNEVVMPRRTRFPVISSRRATPSVRWFLQWK